MKILPLDAALAVARVCGRRRYSIRIQLGKNTQSESNNFELPEGQLLDITFDAMTGLTTCSLGRREEFEALWDSEWVEDIEAEETDCRYTSRHKAGQPSALQLTSLPSLTY